jgi:hypothetical protein
MAYMRVGEVSLMRRRGEPGLIVYEFAWTPDGSGVACLPFDNDLCGHVEAYEAVPTNGAGTYDIRLWDELGSDWLEGLCVGLDATAVARGPVYVTLVGDVTRPVLLMGRPTFRVSGAGSAYGVCRLYVRQFTGGRV